MSALAPLPVDLVLPALRAALDARGSAVLHAPPGAGKTTRVPPAVAAWCAGRAARGEAGAGKVVVLEPRRVAARAAARRIAEERGWSVGREVGWWIRFERRFGDATRIVFATEGVLLRWIQRDPFLDGVAAVVFDEFHERTLAADLSLALVRRVRSEVRPELAVVVMSATLDVDPIARFLGGAPVVASEGRLHPVETRLLDRADDRPLEERVASAARRAADEIDGDLLVFLPGMAEIRRTDAALTPWAARAGVRVLPLHGDLPLEAQDAALRRSADGARRVVLATNVAETSVTVEGVRAVVDSGLARQLRFDPSTGLDRLDTIRISRAAADQRAGRAGREAPGLCLRLWSAADDLALRPFEPPEVRRVDLAGAVLELASWGERDPAAFEWFEPPEPARLERAVESLRELGALTPSADGGSIVTEVGKRIAALPLPPRLGRLVLEGERWDVAEEAALVAALLSERGAERAASERGPRAGTSAPSDLLVRLEALDRRKSRSIFEAERQIVELVRRSAAGVLPEPPAAEIGSSSVEKRLLRAIAAAYLDRLCVRRERGSERAVMVGGRGVRLAKTSAVHAAPLFVAIELDAGRGGERAEALVRAASAVEREWIPSELTKTARELAWDDDRQRVLARRVVRFADLELEASEIPIDDPVGATALLAARATADPSRALALDRPEVASLLDRLRFLARARPEHGLPETDALLLAALPLLAAGKRSLAELARAPVEEALLAALDWKQRAALDAEAPERMEVPSGSRVRIDYSDPERPVLAARIQELFGLRTTPSLAGGRVPLLVHLLAPNGRPQQVTLDLASFWMNTYPIVRRELAARYPKHAWPEDPSTARAERGPKRRLRS